MERGIQRKILALLTFRKPRQANCLHACVFFKPIGLKLFRLGSTRQFRDPGLMKTSRLLIPFFFVTLAIMNFTTISAHDFLWHLKTGEWILEHLRIPKIDLYLDLNFPPPLPWINLHWGFQILVALVHRVSGLGGLQVLKLLLLTATYAVLWRTVRNGASPKIFSIGLLLLSLLTAQSRFQMRPELITFLMIAVFLAVLEGRSNKPTLIIWSLPLLQIVWTNVEGLFMIGPILIAIYLGGELLEKRFCRRLFVIFVLTLLASFINPYGIEGFLFPLRLFSEITFKDILPFCFVGEFLPPYSPFAKGSHIVFFFCILILSALTLLPQFRRIKKTHFLLFVAFTTLALLAQRNIALFAIVSPIILLKNWPKNFSPWVQRVGALGLSTVMLFLNFSAVTNRLYAMDHRVEQFGISIAPQIDPRKALEFLKKIGIYGTLFHPIEWGPAVIYRGWPQFYPWIDTRLEVYGPDLLKKYQEIYQTPAKISEYLTQNKFIWVLLDHIQPNSISLISHLYKNPHWRIVYFDEVAVIFLRKDAAQLLTKKFDGRTPNSVDPLTEALYMGRFFLAVHSPENARQSYRRALELLPTSTESWINLAYIDEHRGYTSRALCFLSQALDTDSKNSTIHYNLGSIYLKLGKYDMAIHYLEESLRIQKSTRALHNLEVAKRKVRMI